MAQLNKAQVEALLKPIKPKRVLDLRGQSHVPAYDVAAHLTRILGFGNWDKTILDLHPLFESETKTSNGKPAWQVAYSCTLRLTIKDEHGEFIACYEDGATGDSLQPSRADAHDMALKSAISYALKRCAAFGLGDQFGLSLYNKGDQSALIRQTLVMPEGAAMEGLPDLQDGISEPLTMGNDERDLESEQSLAEAQAITGTTTGTTSTEGEPQPRPYTEGQAAIRAHAKYKIMDGAAKGQFLSATVGYRVATLRDLPPEDCDQVLAALDKKK